jgi:hypothetical protein
MVIRRYALVQKLEIGITLKLFKTRVMVLEYCALP